MKVRVLAEIETRSASKVFMSSKQMALKGTAREVISWAILETGLQKYFYLQFQVARDLFKIVLKQSLDSS